MSPGPGFSSNLIRRVGTAVVALPLLVGAFFGPPPLGVGVIAVAALLGLYEFLTLARAKGRRPLSGVAFVLGAVLFVETAWPGTVPAPLLPAVLVLLLAAGLSRAATMDTAGEDIAVTLLGVGWLGALGGTLAGLRVLEPVAQGPWRIVLLLAIVMGGDSMAFFTGSAIGRHKLAPLVSPGKTWEGLVGGVVGGILGALGVRAGGLPGLPLLHAVTLGAVVTGAATTGDLAESLLKRWAGVKDSGALFPGHGGMLDRLDSLLFGGPVLYYYFFFAR